MLALWQGKLNKTTSFFFVNDRQKKQEAKKNTGEAEMLTRNSCKITCEKFPVPG